MPGMLTAGVVTTMRSGRSGSAERLGCALMLAALAGFRTVGLRRAYLEVTAQNDSAIRLYRRLGFHKVRTVYKAVEAPSMALR